MDRITILNFSPRSSGNCAGICELIANKYNRTNVFMYSITAEAFPACEGCDYECLKPGQTCPTATMYQKEVMDTVMRSDVVYFVIPNFCGYPCANYFAFNERSVEYFHLDKELMERYMHVPKRFVIVSNSENETFREAMQQQTADQPDILYLKTSRYGKQSIAGDLMESEDAKADLQTWLATK